MLLYPSLAIGFLFVGVPLLVHLINLLRHRRTQWAAMDFLLASYRKQRRWIVLRQLLLLLTRLAVAALLIAVLAGLIGGKRWLGAVGGQTTHHVIVLDDSYSMRQRVAGDSMAGGNTASESDSANPSQRDTTAYDRGLSVVAALVRRLASEEGTHQLTVMRASRATMVANSKDAAADAAADIAAQTITQDARQIERLMSTQASSLRTDLVPAIDLASDLLVANPADARQLYLVSDFAKRDWQSPRRLAQSLEAAEKTGAKISFIDCVDTSGKANNTTTSTPRNLAITDLSPEPDVWVAGVPVTVNVTVKNFSSTAANNVAMTASVITYGRDVQRADPTSTLSGKTQSLPAIMIESIPAGQQLTKSFQVYIDQEGTHVVRIGLPDDALTIDNVRSCTIPLADAQRVLIIDNDPDGLGAYHVSSVLDPGSQVRVGAIPEIRPAAMLRDATLETLQRYRAIYLIDLPDISERTAETLEQYVREGGGLAWFLGDSVNADTYNRILAKEDRNLLPFPIGEIQTANALGNLTANGSTADDKNQKPNSVVLGKDSDLLGPIAAAGNGVFGLVQVNKAWSVHRDHQLTDRQLNASSSPELEAESTPNDGFVDDAFANAAELSSESAESGQPDLDTKVLLQRNDQPLATRHILGRGRVVTVMTDLNPQWNNWAGDPTFVVFLLQSNAMLFSGAAPPTSRFVDEPAELPLPGDTYLPTVTMLPPADEPPRLSIEIDADTQPTPGADSPNQLSTMLGTTLKISPTEMAITDQAGFDEFLMPGIVEWQRTQTDGQTTVTPMATVLRVGESNLASTPHSEIVRDLAPMKVQFLSPSTWQNNDSIGGMSTFLLFLLGLLAVLLAVEQALAAWASYHVNPSTAPRTNHLRANPARSTHSRAGLQGSTTVHASGSTSRQQATDDKPLETSR
ncbi:BatA domain-containing protein [Neorhodopirellula lusitana]|nr:BatA domain-containing protein [Neorhodopirellula lusitana]